MPEIFNYWLQPGRIDVGFLGAAQIDRFANINTTVIGGAYDEPKVRLPGAGGAPEIAASCGEVIVIVRQSPRTFVERVDFVTSVGYGAGRGDRERLGLPGRGPVKVITDLGVLEPDPETCELTLTALHEGVSVEDARAATGWELRVCARRRRDPGALGRRAGGAARAGFGLGLIPRVGRRRWRGLVAPRRGQRRSLVAGGGLPRLPRPVDCPPQAQLSTARCASGGNSG